MKASDNPFVFYKPMTQLAIESGLMCYKCKERVPEGYKKGTNFYCPKCTTDIKEKNETLLKEGRKCYICGVRSMDVIKVGSNNYCPKHPPVPRKKKIEPNKMPKPIPKSKNDEYWNAYRKHIGLKPCETCGR